MADQLTTDLKYGHFGQAIYNSEDQTWLFPRNLESSSSLQPLGTSQLVFKSQHAQSRPDSTTEKPSIHLNRQIAELVNFDPTLAPGAHLLSEPAIVSGEVQKTAIRYDPTVGHLLAFGRVPDDSTKRSMPIVAFPAADHTHVLRLVQVQPQKHGWEHNKSIWIDVPRIYGESGIWHAPHPIRQISFADADEDSNLARTLAVRTTLAVHILRIAAKRHASSWNSLTDTPSRFDTHQLCTLSLDLLGGVAPAHVAFNRWYPKQFVTVDQHGTWRVWDSSLRQLPSDQGKPTELCRGATSDKAVSDHEANATLLDDGWGRATWAGNVQTIVTASRKCLAIYDIQGKPVRLQSPNLGISGTPHWILDVLLNPVDSTLVFVLTSTSLFCLRVRCLDGFDPESYSTAGAEVVLQCRHFRDPEDIGLDAVVLIKSSLSPLATSYRFISGDSSPQFLTVADATQTVLPELPSTATSATAFLTFDLQAAEYGESSHHETSSGPGKIYRDLSVKFFVATAITSDMVVVQKLYFAIPKPETASSFSSIVPPDWRGRLVHSRPRLNETSFVEHSAVHQGVAKIQREEEAALSSGLDMLKSARDNWTMLYELSHARTTSAASQTEDFSRILVRVGQVLEILDAVPGRHKLLSEFCDSQILVPDIDQVAAEFRDMIASRAHFGDEAEEIEQSLLLANIAGIDALDLGLKGDINPMDVYDNIIAHWLTPLSQNVPGRIRLVKEQLARRISAEICLASHVLRQPPVESARTETQTTETQGIEHFASSQLHFPQSSLPTPSPTATPSLTTMTSLSSHPSTLVSSEFARLQRYTSFSSEKSTPGPLPKPLTNTLAHWSLGGNPDEYDWLAIQRDQERRAEEEDEDLTPKERARLKRRAEKHLLKQRRSLGFINVLSYTIAPRMAWHKSTALYEFTEDHLNQDFELFPSTTSIVGQTNGSKLSPVTAKPFAEARSFSNGSDPMAQSIDSEQAWLAWCRASAAQDMHTLPVIKARAMPSISDSGYGSVEYTDRHELDADRSVKPGIVDPRHQQVPQYCEICYDESEKRRYFSNNADRSVLTVKTSKFYYRCAAPACQKKDKIWPRKDNFKAHLEGTHKYDEVEVAELLMKVIKTSKDRRPSRKGPLANHEGSINSESPSEEVQQEFEAINSETVPSGFWASPNIPMESTDFILQPTQMDPAAEYTYPPSILISDDSEVNACEPTSPIEMMDTTTDFMDNLYSPYLMVSASSSPYAIEHPPTPCASSTYADSLFESDMDDVTTDNEFDIDVYEQETVFQPLLGPAIQQLLAAYTMHRQIAGGERSAHTSHPSSFGSNFAVESTSGGSSLPPVGSKRRRTVDDDGDDNEDEQPPRRRSKVTKSDEDLVPLACPFNKLDPIKHDKCYTFVLKGISRVNEPVHCPKCYSIFRNNPEARDKHVRQGACHNAPERRLEGIDEATMRKLKRRVTGKSVGESWYSIFTLLFPGARKPESPSVMDTTLSAELSAFRDFWTQEGQNIVTSIVDASMPSWGHPHEQLEDFARQVFQTASEHLFHQWQNRSRSAASAPAMANPPVLPPTPTSTFIHDLTDMGIGGAFSGMNDEEPLLPASQQLQDVDMQWMGSEPQQQLQQMMYFGEIPHMDQQQQFWNDHGVLDGMGGWSR
ncbi:hypothetical protein D6D10_00865 [Aureobasidium pullulans]|uniref:Uncharacterized protein n=1 Tax=Aureobasidium pullulans TaxID=5580 RepID=A0A4S9F858_AURPU|nr:hypothetical protein D6D10_00865 [Aureobasidium pullulans]